MPQYSLSAKETVFTNVAPNNGTAPDSRYTLSSQYSKHSVNDITPFVAQSITQYRAANEQAVSLFRNWYQQPLYLPPRRPETFPTQWFIPPPPGATFLFDGASQAFSLGCQPQQHSHNAGSFGPQQQYALFLSTSRKVVLISLMQEHAKSFWPYPNFYKGSEVCIDFLLTCSLSDSHCRGPYISKFLSVWQCMVQHGVWQGMVAYLPYDARHPDDHTWAYTYLGKIFKSYGKGNIGTPVRV